MQRANTRLRLRACASAAAQATIKAPSDNRRARRVRRCVNNCAQSTSYRRVQSNNLQEWHTWCIFRIDFSHIPGITLCGISSVVCSPHSDVCICALLTSTHLVSLRSGYLLGCGCHFVHELCREFIFGVERPVELLGMLGRQLSRHHRAIVVLDVCSGACFCVFLCSSHAISMVSRECILFIRPT